MPYYLFIDNSKLSSFNKSLSLEQFLKSNILIFFSEKYAVFDEENVQLAVNINLCDHIQNMHSASVHITDQFKTGFNLVAYICV